MVYLIGTLARIMESEHGNYVVETVPSGVYQGIVIILERTK
ncbi:MAG: hypothetical protein ACFFBH_09060 [Promethearchaeota archaeon]